MTRKRKFIIYGSVCLAVILLAGYFVLVVLRFDSSDIKIHPDGLVEIEGDKLDPADQANDAKIHDFLNRKIRKDNEAKWYEPWLDKIGIHKDDRYKNTIRINILDPKATRWKCIKPIIDECVLLRMKGVYLNQHHVELFNMEFFKRYPVKHAFDPIDIVDESKYELAKKALKSYAESNPEERVFIRLTGETGMDDLFKTISIIEECGLISCLTGFYDRTRSLSISSHPSFPRDILGDTNMKPDSPVTRPSR